MSIPTISAAALQAAADHGVPVPVDPGAQYGVEVARHCTTEALIAALRERGIATATAERAAALRFLQSEEERFEKGSERSDIGVDGRERCRNKASVLRTVMAYIERGDHENSAAEW